MSGNNFNPLTTLEFKMLLEMFIQRLTYATADQEVLSSIPGSQYL